MNWKGSWKNQYGSTLTITDDEDGNLEGTFETALDDSQFYGSVLPIRGLHQGDCISFAFSSSAPGGEAICSFTGLARDSRIETVWHVVADSAPAAGSRSGRVKRRWAHAVLTNADTFTRADE